MSKLLTQSVTVFPNCQGDRIPAELDPDVSSAMASTRRVVAEMSAQNEQMWISLAQLAESMHDLDRAYRYYENVLAHNSDSIVALTCLGSLARSKNNHQDAIQYFVRLTRIDPRNGEVWGALGHCFLQLDNLPEAYHAYQQALFYLKEPKNPSLWYGIGVLYDRYGSWHHAEEAFTSVVQMSPNFEKVSEIYYRLGMLYNMQGRVKEALDCFERTLALPPDTFPRVDALYQIALIRLLQREFSYAHQLLEQIVEQEPNHLLSLRELAWLYYCNAATPSQNLVAKFMTATPPAEGHGRVDVAITLLQRALDINRSDMLTAYLLGRCYMEKQAFTTAYEMFESCIRLNPGNPYFWVSIGVLYHLIYQYRDALDAYTRSIRQNPNLVEAWYNLGSLYEASNNQLRDAAEAYEKCLNLDPQRQGIAERYEKIVDMIRYEESKQPQRVDMPQLGSPPVPIQPQPLALSTFVQPMPTAVPRASGPHQTQPQQLVRSLQMSPSAAMVGVAPVERVLLPGTVPQEVGAFGGATPMPALNRPTLQQTEPAIGKVQTGAMSAAPRKRGRPPSNSVSKVGPRDQVDSSQQSGAAAPIKPPSLTLGEHPKKPKH